MVSTRASDAVDGDGDEEFLESDHSRSQYSRVAYVHCAPGVASVVSSGAAVVQMGCFVPAASGAGIPCCGPIRHSSVDATFCVVAFVAVVGDDAHFSRDILAVIAADGWRRMLGVRE